MVRSRQTGSRAGLARHSSRQWYCGGTEDRHYLNTVKANLAGASISQGRMEGMTIEGVLVSDLLAAHRASTSPENKTE
jgi:hypothetical protein